MSAGSASSEAPAASAPAASALPSAQSKWLAEVANRRPLVRVSVCGVSYGVHGDTLRQHCPLLPAGCSQFDFPEFPGGAELFECFLRSFYGAFDFDAFVTPGNAVDVCLAAGALSAHRVYGRVVQLLDKPLGLSVLERLRQRVLAVAAECAHVLLNENSLMDAILRAAWRTVHAAHRHAATAAIAAAVASADKPAEPGVEHKRADFADAPGGSSGAEQSASTASISTKCDKSGDQDAEWLSALLQWGAGLRPALLLRFVAVGDALFAPPSAATSAAATDASTKEQATSVESLAASVQELKAPSQLEHKTEDAPPLPQLEWAHGTREHAVVRLLTDYVLNAAAKHGTDAAQLTLLLDALEQAMHPAEPASSAAAPGSPPQQPQQQLLRTALFVRAAPSLHTVLSRLVKAVATSHALWRIAGSAAKAERLAQLADWLRALEAGERVVRGGLAAPKLADAGLPPVKALSQLLEGEVAELRANIADAGLS